MKRKALFFVGAAVLPMIAGFTSLVAQGPGSPMPNYPYSSFRFNFINPGGRASGMGQAYIAMADDATGAETNPAGLCALVKPQFFVEGRYIRNRFGNIDPASATRVRYQDIWTGKFSPTFLSVVFPRKQWAFSLYRQELANYSISKVQPSVLFEDVRVLIPPPSRPVQVNQFSTDLTLKAVNWGFSLSRRWGERINVGLSARATELSLDSLETTPGMFLNPFQYYLPDGQTEAVLHRTTGSSLAWSFVVGGIFKPYDWLRIGAVYRSGSRHAFTANFNVNIFDNSTHQPIWSQEAFDVHVPRRYGVGVAVLPTERLAVTFDLIRIDYSQMTPPFVGYIQKEFRDDYAFEDGVSLRMGAEYTFFWRRVPVSIRGGYYTDPDNSLHYVGDRNFDDALPYLGRMYPIGEVIDNYPKLQSVMFPRAGTDHHFTAGVGMTLKTHFQFEFAADLSGDRTNLVLSILYNL